MPEPTSESQWLVTVQGISGTFQTKTGGEVSVEHTGDYDGGALEREISQGKPLYSDMTVGRSYKLARDPEVAKRLRQILSSGNRFKAVVTAQPLTEQQTTAGAPTIYDGVLKSVSPQEANSNSSQPSRLELVFTVTAIR